MVDFLIEFGEFSFHMLLILNYFAYFGIKLNLHVFKPLVDIGSVLAMEVTKSGFKFGNRGVFVSVHLLKC